MPEAKILKRLEHQLEAKGMNPGSARAIAVSQLTKAGDLKKGTLKPTAKGISRGNMSPAERAKDRAHKESGRPVSDYTYNSKTNRATLKK